MEKTMTLKEKFGVAGWIFKRVHRVNPHMIPLTILHSILQVVEIYFPIIGLRYILAEAIAKNWLNLLYVSLIVFGGSTVLGMLNRFIEYKTEIMGLDINGKIMIELNSHAMQVDYHTATSPGLKEKFRVALNNMIFEMGNFRTFIMRCASILKNIVSIITSVTLTVYLIISVATHTPESPFLRRMVTPVGSLITALVLIAVGLVAQIGIMRSGIHQRRSYLQEHSKAEAKLNYYVGEVASSTEKFDLYQNYNMLDMLRERILTEVREVFGFFAKQVGAERKITFGTATFNAVNILAAYGIAGLKALYGAIPVSSLLTYARAFVQLNEASSSIFNWIMLLDSSLIYFRDIKEFTELDNKLDTGSIPVEKRRDHEMLLELENVSFRYPGSDVDVLKNVSFKLDMNQRHALVGPNGAGKSTLVYLLTRLYNPTEGRILLNGVDVRKYDYEEYLSLFSVVFQDFQLFALPLGENVSAKADYDAAEVLRNLGRAGFLTEAERTEDLLQEEVVDIRHHTKRFSGGEMQKIAIARALQKNGSFVILDEPTAALDPKAEAEIYEHLQNLIENKTTIFISHRMSSCRLCEDIIVLDDGRLVERGSHEKLVGEGGLYSEMWRAQAKYYQ